MQLAASVVGVEKFMFKMFLTNKFSHMKFSAIKCSSRKTAWLEGSVRYPVSYKKSTRVLHVHFFKISTLIHKTINRKKAVVQYNTSVLYAFLQY